MSHETEYQQRERNHKQEMLKVVPQAKMKGH